MAMTATERMSEQVAGPVAEPATQRATEPVTQAPPRQRRARLRASLLPALVVLLTVQVLGATYVLAQPSQWTASGAFAVLPVTTEDQTAASYFETLARGQIVSTIAEVVTVEPQDLPAGVTVEVEVVPETSVIRLTTTADTEEAAVSVAQARLDAATDSVTALEIPFAARVVDRPTDTVDEVAPRLATNLGIIFLTGLGLALAVQQAIAMLLRSRSSRASRSVR